MADIVQAGSSGAERFKDMGDGTFAPVLAIGGAVVDGVLSAQASLSAVATGTGTTVDLGGARRAIAFAISTAGTVTGGAVQMQVSEDGTNWFTPPSSAFQNDSAATLANPYTLAAGPGPVALFVLTNAAFRYARVNVTSNVTGGGTVSATVSGV